MEHIAQLEKFLSVIHALLKPRGTYAYFQAPFWTCKAGHHSGTTTRRSGRCSIRTSTFASARTLQSPNGSTL